MIHQPVQVHNPPGTEVRGNAGIETADRLAGGDARLKHRLRRIYIPLPRVEFRRPDRQLQEDRQRPHHDNRNHPTAVPGRDGGRGGFETRPDNATTRQRDNAPSHE
jgi:hypothetical protein